MSRIGKGIAALASAATVVACAAPVAQAASWPHDRNGFMIGFGIGGGSLGLEDGEEREGSGLGNFRIGWAVRPDLVLALETEGWTKEIDTTPGEVTWTFSVATAALTWYPGAGGGYLRGGIGVGVADAELDLGSVRIVGEESGLGAAAAAGYEWRLTRKFALGPEVQFFWMDLEDVLGSANVVGGSLNFDWYW